MNTNELKAHIAGLRAKNVDGVIKLLGQAIVAVVVVWCVSLVMDALVRIAEIQNADGLSAFARVVEALNLGSVIGYIGAALAGTAWFRERKGRQRAIEEKAHYQKLAEAAESGRTSSGLSPVGETPRG